MFLSSSESSSRRGEFAETGTESSRRARNPLADPAVCSRLRGFEDDEWNMTIETNLLYLAALGVFFATRTDTGQVLIITNSARHGLKKSGGTIAGDLAAS